MTVQNLERRVTPGELRAKPGRKLVGYAIVYNSLSTDLGGFREIIKPGAAAKALQHSDVRALWNHDSNIVLGRSKSGTLRMKEDPHGLLVEIDLPNTTAADDLLESVRRGDVSQMSFGFQIAPGGEQWSREDGKQIRTITEFAYIFDVSPVTFAAYEATVVSARALKRAKPDGKEYLRWAKERLANRAKEIGIGPARSGASMAELRRIVERNRRDVERDTAAPPATPDAARDALRNALQAAPPTSELWREAYRTAVHEAAHAVAFYLEGAGVAEMAIHAKMKPGGRFGLRQEPRPAGGVCRSRREIYYNPVPSLVGAVAEKRVYRYGVDPTPSHSRSDTRGALKVLERGMSQPLPYGGAYQLRAAEKEAEAFVTKNWRAILEVADELMREIHMDGAKAERAISIALGIQRAA